MRSDDFSLRDLFIALDEQRRSRSLSWSQATREIARQSADSSKRALSVSTVTGTRTLAVAEADGVLQMLLWLHRTPESFMPKRPDHEDARATLPEVSQHQVLRFDTRKLHTALDAKRIARGMTWPEVSREVGLSAPSLTYLARGGRTGFPHVMRIVRWLGLPAAYFTRFSDR
jgi:hypothetical protein